MVMVALVYFIYQSALQVRCKALVVAVVFILLQGKKTGGGVGGSGISSTRVRCKFPCKALIVLVGGAGFNLLECIQNLFSCCGRSGSGCSAGCSSGINFLLQGK